MLSLDSRLDRGRGRAGSRRRRSTSVLDAPSSAWCSPRRHPTSSRRSVRYRRHSRSSADRPDSTARQRTRRRRRARPTARASGLSLRRGARCSASTRGWPPAAPCGSTRPHSLSPRSGRIPTGWETPCRRNRGSTSRRGGSWVTSVAVPSATMVGGEHDRDRAGKPPPARTTGRRGPDGGQSRHPMSRQHALFDQRERPDAASRRAARCSPASRPGCGATGRLAALAAATWLTPVWRSTHAEGDLERCAGRGWGRKAVA